MKKLIFPVLTLALLAIVPACKKEKAGTVKFDMPYTDYVSLEAGGVAYIPFTFETKDAPTNASAQFSGKTTPDKIKEIRLKKFVLTIVSPAGADFKFLKSISVGLLSNTLPFAQAAYKYEVPETIGNQLVLDIVDRDLKDYVKGETFKLKATITAKVPIPQNMDIKSDIVFGVTADPL